MTVSDIITGALRLLGVYGLSDTVEAEDLAECLVTLNDLVNQWNAEHLVLFHVLGRSLPITSFTGTYTIGAGGTFDVARPVKIETAGILQANTLRSELKMDTAREWAQIPEKTVKGKLPLRIYCDYDFPVATLKLWPIPTQDCTLELDVWEGLDDSMVLGFELRLPPAYARALRYNLAIAVAPGYGIEPSPAILKIADEAKAKLMQLNASTFAGKEDLAA